MDSAASSSKPTYGTKGKIIRSQGQEITSNVMSFMKEEAVRGLILSLQCHKHRTIAATQVSDSTYRRILKTKKNIEAGECSVFTSPRKKRPKQNPNEGVTEDDVCVFEKGEVKSQLVNASEERNDGKAEFFRKENLKVHQLCRKNYTRKSSIPKDLQVELEKDKQNSAHSTRSLRSTVSDLVETVSSADKKPTMIKKTLQPTEWGWLQAQKMGLPCSIMYKVCHGMDCQSSNPTLV
ncbi:hypothetical protein FQR65_LT12326 [Abscondita terminalis]|nr:hypothetical protein FQR65_LT12326 [Abscondita terminalis]